MRYLRAINPRGRELYVVSVLHYSKWQLNAVDDTTTEALDLAVIEVYCRPVMWAMRAAKSSCLKVSTSRPSARYSGSLRSESRNVLNQRWPEEDVGGEKNDKLALLVVERWSTKVAEVLAHAYLL